jgi:1-acyl-sn-glycerol-3-phosphate acyltransferase
MNGFIMTAAVRIFLGPRRTFTAALQGTLPRVFFANHSSHLDFIVIWASLPAEVRRVTRPVAARDYWTQGRIRRFIAGRLFGGLMIQRTKPADGDGDNPVAQMLEVLDRGDSLILFPEGTRGSGDAIAPFRSGLYQIHVARPDVPLIPVYLENLNRVLPKGEFVPVPMLSRVTFGAPLTAAEVEERGAFLDRARRAVADLEAV